MIRPSDPNDPELRKFGRIAYDCATATLWLVTFCVVYGAFLALQGATALPRFVLGGAARAVRGLAARNWGRSLRRRPGQTAKG